MKTLPFLISQCLHLHITQLSPDGVLDVVAVWLAVADPLGVFVGVSVAVVEMERVAVEEDDVVGSGVPLGRGDATV